MWIFKIFKNRILMEANFLKKPYIVSHEVPQKIWARSVKPFWRFLNTNKHHNTNTRQGVHKLWSNIQIFIFIFDVVYNWSISLLPPIVQWSNWYILFIFFFNIILIGHYPGIHCSTVYTYNVTYTYLACLCVCVCVFNKRLNRSSPISHDPGYGLWIQTNTKNPNIYIYI